jgi:hypothetical protein
MSEGSWKTCGYVYRELIRANRIYLRRVHIRRFRDSVQIRLESEEGTLPDVVV